MKKKRNVFKVIGQNLREDVHIISQRLNGIDRNIDDIKLRLGSLEIKFGKFTATSKREIALTEQQTDVFNSWKRHGDQKQVALEVYGDELKQPAISRHLQRIRRKLGVQAVQKYSKGFKIGSIYEIY